MALFFLSPHRKKMKLSLFGVGQSDPEIILSPALERLEGVKFARYDRRRNIAEVEVDRRSPVTGDELVQTILSTGYGAEVLTR